MEYITNRILLKDGSACTIRAVRSTDAAALVTLLRETAGESRFLLREPEEITMTEAEEEAFLAGRLSDERSLMLVGEVAGKVVGLCSLVPVAPFARYAHRCEVSVVLRRAYWGQGCGTALMEALLAAAKAAGYEQVHLDVVADNTAAVGLYIKLGFTSCGTKPRAMKYKDGSYADEISMVKML